MERVEEAVIPVASISFKRLHHAGFIEEDILFPFPTLSGIELELPAPDIEPVNTFLEAFAAVIREWDEL